MSKDKNETPGMSGEYDSKFKFGDIVENHWASENNPHRKGIVVRVGSKSLYITDGKGNFWNLIKDKDSKTKIIGHYTTPAATDAKSDAVEVA